jgi:glutathione-specific gamma-glutamylcyclotransferase
MWNPDFSPAEACPARLYGHHRALCILSTIYRGTPSAPGLVLGLDRGGSCVGRALRVPAARWAQVKARLDERELPTGVYLPAFLPVRLKDGRRVDAYAYVVDRNHRQYWRGDRAEALLLLRQGRGKGGAARDYLALAVAQMTQMGIGAGRLHGLLRDLDRTD